MRFPAADVTGGRMLATAGDGIVRESLPGAARLASLSASNYFVGAAGAGGPDLSPGTTMLIRWWDTTPTADNFVWGYGDGASGWALDCSKTNIYIYLRNPGANALTVTGQGRIYGINSIAITRAAGGAIRASLNGSNAVLVSATPTYVAGSASAAEYVGRSAPGIGSFGSANSGIIDQAFLTREASDAELQEWSRTDGSDPYHIHATPLADAALVLRRRAEDWDGSAASWACAVGSRTLTKTGSPTKATLAARTRYTIPAWAFLDGPQTTVESQRQFGSRIRVTTDAQELGIVLKDNLGSSSGALVSHKGAGIYVGADSVGKGGAWVSDLRAYGAAGNPSTVEAAGLGAGSKTLDIIEALTIQRGSFPAGPFSAASYNVTKVTVPASASLSFGTRPSVTSRILYVTDSIGEQVVQAGAMSTRQAWTMLSRVNRGGVAVDAIGASSYYSRAYQSAWRAASIAKWSAALDGTTTNILWLALGANDYWLIGAGSWPSGIPGFQACVAAVFDDWHAARPTVPIYAQVPITRATEGTIEQWRQAIRDAASGRAWVTIVETMSPALAADGVHPNIAGHATIEANVRAVLGY